MSCPVRQISSRRLTPLQVNMQLPAPHFPLQHKAYKRLSRQLNVENVSKVTSNITGTNSLQNVMDQKIDTTIINMIVKEQHHEHGQRKECWNELLQKYNVRSKPNGHGKIRNHGKKIYHLRSQPKSTFTGSLTLLISVVMHLIFIRNIYMKI